MNEAVFHRSEEIDAVKATAIFGVVVIHTCSDGYSLPMGSWNWISTVFWGSVVRAAVPLFLMCSGALLLSPEKALPVKKLYTKNILRLLAAMWTWSMLYKCYHLASEWGFPIGEEGFPFTEILQSLKEIFLFQQEFHFYYLHIMLLVYVFLPATRVFTQSASQSQLRYALVLWLVFGVIYPSLRPFWPLNLLSGIPSQWLLNMSYSSIGYGVLGFYLSRRPFRLQTHAILFSAGFLSVFFGVYLLSLRSGSLYTGFFEGMFLGVAVMAAGAFGIFIRLTKKIPAVVRRVFRFLSQASFCIYLVHVLFLYLFHALGLRISMGPCFLTIPALALCNLACSGLIYLLLAKIPVIRRFCI